MSQLDRHALACRRLWVVVVQQVLSSYWEDRQGLLQRRQHDAAQGRVDAAANYFASRDGRHVLALAGLEPEGRTFAGLVAIVAGNVRPSTLMSNEHHSSED